MGVLDEEGILESGQIFLAISPSNGEEEDRVAVKAKKVLVTKNPCLHPGDLRVLEARSDELTDKHFSHLTNCVVFPRKGSRPHTAEISGSDLDGDLYFVTWDQRLIPPETCQPFEYDQAAAKTFN